MKLQNIVLDIIALTEEQLFMRRVVEKLPLIAALVIVLVIVVAVLIRRRK